MTEVNEHQITGFFEDLFQYREHAVSKILTEHPELANFPYPLTKELPIIIAARKCYIRLIPVLEKYGADISARNEYGDTILILLLKGTSPGDWDLKHAPAIDCEVMNDLLARLDLSTDSKGMSPLHYAALEQHLTLIPALCKRDPAMVKAKDNLGRTPLHFACAVPLPCSLTRPRAVINALMTHGADMSIRDDNGETAKNYLLRSLACGNFFLRKSMSF